MPGSRIGHDLKTEAKDLQIGCGVLEEELRASSRWFSLSNELREGGVVH